MMIKIVHGKLDGIFDGFYNNFQQEVASDITASVDEAKVGLDGSVKFGDSGRSNS